jgi:hypothetical protein
MALPFGGVTIVLTSSSSRSASICMSRKTGNPL